MVFHDVREALKDLLNISSRKYREPPLDEAATFISRYGPLRRFQFPAGTTEIEEGLKKYDPNDPKVAVLTLSAVFSATRAVPHGINAVLNSIFAEAEIDGRKQPPALQADILAGTIKPIPRDLLDAIAVEFMRSYKTIGRCERCQRFFFKDYNTDRYCSTPCAEQARSEAQRDWMRNYRAEQKRKAKQKTRRAS